MKTRLVALFLLMFFVSACVTSPAPIPASAAQTATLWTSITSSATGTAIPSATAAPPTSTNTPYPVTPTFISASLPNDLVVAYVVKDALWIWQQNQSRLLVQRENISAPLISDDGQWLLFRQRHILLDGRPPSDELWVVRIDGSELRRLVGSEDLKALTGGTVASLIGDIGWQPGSHKILFNTEEIVEGPPGSWPTFDLYSLDLEGHVTRLAKPGQGGRFVSSPDGSSVALASDSRIGVLNLESGKYRTLLEFKHLELGCECVHIPSVVWDPQGHFVLTSILPHKLYYPEEYAGEPEQIWRLFVDGQTELVAQLKPFAPAAGVAYSQDLRNFFYLNNSCGDGMGMLTVHNLDSAEESPLLCLWKLPRWLPDNEHFVYEADGLWQLGSISDRTNHRLDFLNPPTDLNVYASPQLTWIDNQYFLVVLRSRDACTLSVATLQGVITEITSTPPDVCPSRLDFNLSK